MHKLKDLKVQKMAAAVLRLNNELDYYPDRDANTKFSKELVGVLLNLVCTYRVNTD